MLRTLLLVGALTVGALRAQGQAVVADARTLLTWHHSSAPVPLLVDLRSDRVVTGTLRVRILQGSTVLAELVQPDVAVGTAGQTLALVVPPPSGCVPTSRGGNGVTRVAVAFAPDGGPASPAGEIPILFHGVGLVDDDADPTRPGRTALSVLTLATKVGREDATLRQARTLFEREGDSPDRDTERRTFQPRIAVIADTEFPQEPIAYCAADLVVLAGECIDQLRPAQLAALATWVRAGGRLACVLEGELPGQPFADVLGRLVAAREPPFELARWLARPLTERLVRCELGAIAVCATAEELAVPAVRTALFPVVHEVVGSRDPFGANEVGGGAHAFLAELVANLPRQKFEVIPVGWLAIVFVVLLVLVGPIDGWLLRPRSRRATWILLPLAVGIATWVIIELPARRYRGIEQRQRLLLEDVAADGTALRRWELTLAFPGESGDIVLEGAGARVRIDTTTLDLQEATRRRPIIMGQWGDTPTGPVGYTSIASERGPASAHQRTTLNVARWTPLVLLRFDLGTPATPGVDWPALARAAAQSPVPLPGIVVDPLVRACPPGTVVEWLSGTAELPLRGNTWSRPRGTVLTANRQRLWGRGQGTDQHEWVLAAAAHAALDAHHCPRGGTLPPFGGELERWNRPPVPTPSPERLATIVVAWRDDLGIVVQRHTFTPPR